jgi:hypothetical protein
MSVVRSVYTIQAVLAQCVGSNWSYLYWFYFRRACSLLFNLYHKFMAVKFLSVFKKKRFNIKDSSFRIRTMISTSNFCIKKKYESEENQNMSLTIRILYPRPWSGSRAGSGPAKLVLYYYLKMQHFATMLWK